ncbi:sensor histidine kinase [Myceligenerans pegani]|uniref:histidine kinase n=1 Tax=Myceligenerans pegani TaxID=2776917 RepID=A0ABR9MZQ5_9MICO|nr:sensor histidine kinase [Myceligenerans sp. TRM 65318]MBE1876399.1 sensor histidine kinase [Myceligenerans sp. TRM 65318]MBE3018670.1 sensor histidine kinase [Myceligenerans sp. TRM 65318]
MESPSLYERVSGWFERHRFATDVTVAVILGGFVLIGSIGSYEAVLWEANLPTWFPPVWSAFMMVPMAWVRTRPVASTAAMLVLALTHMALAVPVLMPVDLLLPYSLYGLTAYGPRWGPRAGIIAAAGGCFLLFLEMKLLTGDDNGAAEAAGIFAFLIFCTAWALGLFRRSRRAMLDALRDRAERLQLERDQQAAIATGAERARIAREMHDVVAHSLSIVIAQADGGRYAARSDPAAASRALDTIAETGRAALADMRKILGVLRTSPAPGEASLPGGPASSGGSGPSGRRPSGPGAEPAPIAPQPDVAQIEALVEQSRADGMRVSYARIGEERQLPPGIGLNIYRVAQEALTNVRKHAGPDPRVTVLVRWGEREIELKVSDDGRGLASSTPPSAPGAGYGLVGMRERAELFGGTLTAGPRSGGGFHVRFVVPVPAAASDVGQHLELAPSDPADGTLADVRAGTPANAAVDATADAPTGNPADGTTAAATGSPAVRTSGTRSATPTDEEP